MKNVNQGFVSVREDVISDATRGTFLLATVLKLKKKKINFYQGIKCIEKQLNVAGSRAVTCNFEGFPSVDAPASVKVTSTDAIIGSGPWSTDGHIESEGDDSISYSPLGDKNHDRGVQSVFLEPKVKSIAYLWYGIQRGPSKVEKDKVKFFISDSNPVLCPPALCAHVVLTVSAGPFLVCRWEGTLAADVKRGRQVLN